MQNIKDSTGKIERLAKRICRDYILNGVCDKTYVANSIAYDSGSGDGQGTIWSDSINVVKAARYLKSAYSANIYPDTYEYLIEILSGKRISKLDRISNYRKILLHWQQEMLVAKQRNDEWRVEYLSKQSAIINNIIIKETT